MVLPLSMMARGASARHRVTVSATTWDPALTSAHVILSNGNLTAQGDPSYWEERETQATSTWDRATAKTVRFTMLKISDQKYWQVGLRAPGTTGRDNAWLIYYGKFGTLNQGSNPSPTTEMAIGDYVTFRCTATAQVYVSRNGGTEVGPISASGLSTNLVPFFHFIDFDNGVTADFSLF